MDRFLFRWLTGSLALLVVALIVPGIKVSVLGALLAAIVLGLFNAVLRPVLIVLTLPITILTLGLFIFVINAILFWTVAWLVPGFTVHGFWAALVGAFLYGLCGVLVNAVAGVGQKSRAPART